MMEVQLLKQAEVAYLLRRNLGPGAGWEDLLADMRKGKRNYQGLNLMPFVIVGSDGGKIGRPMYEPREVATFLEEAMRITPPPPKPSALESVVVEINPSALDLPWFMRRGKQVSR